MILILISFKQKPKTPPSFIEDKVKRIDFKIASKKFLKNPTVIKALLVVGLAMGAFNGFISVIAFFLEPYGIEDVVTL